MGSSIEPMGPSRRGRGNSSLSLEMRRELFWGASAWPLSSLLCPPPGYFRCPQFAWLSQGSLRTGSFTWVGTLMSMVVQNGSHPFLSQQEARPCRPKGQKALPHYSIGCISNSSPGEVKALRHSSLRTATGTLPLDQLNRDKLSRWLSG